MVKKAFVKAIPIILKLKIPIIMEQKSSKNVSVTLKLSEDRKMKNYIFQKHKSIFWFIGKKNIKIFKKNLFGVISMKVTNIMFRCQK